MLSRELGLLGAIMMGLGAMLGTGVFVGIGIAAGIAGPSVVLAIAFAALIALCNALSSAQLAASLPVSGGTYEYGYTYLTPSLGFTAGFMFLCAKTASAASAALGFAGYFARSFGPELTIVPIALTATILMTGLVAAGMRRTNAANMIIVSLTLAALLFFILAGAQTIWANGSEPWVPFIRSSVEGSGGPFAALAQASALMFVAFTGYARIATLGEEVKDPRHTIPRAIIVTLALSALLYIAVGATAIATIGPAELARSAQSDIAPLDAAARGFRIPDASPIIAAGAMTAMLGVLLNLLLGLSRVLLAMGRRGDMPRLFASLSHADSPVAAVLAAGGAIAALAFIGDVKLTWSFSAFTVLIYYSITNLAALRLPKDKRLYSPLIAWAGLAACLFLAFWVERDIWIAGLSLIAVGLVWHAVARHLERRASNT
jgi:APA family basic amino acid/polyamine antiporter